MPKQGKLRAPTTEGVAMNVTMEMVLVLMFAQVLFAYYYIAARVCGITLARVW